MKLRILVKIFNAINYFSPIFFSVCFAVTLEVFDFSILYILKRLILLRNSKYFFINHYKLFVHLFFEGLCYVILRKSSLVDKLIILQINYRARCSLFKEQWRQVWECLANQRVKMFYLANYSLLERVALVVNYSRTWFLQVSMI